MVFGRAEAAREVSMAGRRAGVMPEVWLMSLEDIWVVWSAQGYLSSGGRCDGVGGCDGVVLKFRCFEDEVALTGRNPK